MEFHMPAREFFPDTQEEDWEPHRDWLVDEGALVHESDSIVLPMQSYVVKTSHHTILVDTCVGNDKQRPNRPTWHQKTDTTNTNFWCQQPVTDTIVPIINQYKTPKI